MVVVQVLDEILETERQALLWEKKIELEKEAQAALDPQAGMAECGAMEREIHRYTHTLCLSLSLPPHPTPETRSQSQSQWCG